MTKTLPLEEIDESLEPTHTIRHRDESVHGSSDRIAEDYSLSFEYLQTSV